MDQVPPPIPKRGREAALRGFAHRHAHRVPAPIDDNLHRIASADSCHRSWPSGIGLIEAQHSGRGFPAQNQVLSESTYCHDRNSTLNDLDNGHEGGRWRTDFEENFDRAPFEKR